MRSTSVWMAKITGQIIRQINQKQGQGHASLVSLVPAFVVGPIAISTAGGQFCKKNRQKMFIRWYETIVIRSKDLSDERFSAKLRVTENRCVVFDFSTYVSFVLWTFTKLVLMRKAKSRNNNNENNERGFKILFIASVLPFPGPSPSDIDPEAFIYSLKTQ